MCAFIVVFEAIIYEPMSVAVVLLHALVVDILIKLGDRSLYN